MSASSSSFLVPLVYRDQRLASRLRSHGITWERALRHFSNAVVRGTDKIQLEHAQRVSSLFCQGGAQKDLVRWSRLFRSECVPLCTTQLVALTHHHMWTEVVEALNASLFPWQPLLAEDAISQAMEQGAWREALRMVHAFPTFTIADTLPARVASTELAVSAQHLKQKKGIAMAVASCTRGASWMVSVRLCDNLRKICSPASASSLLDLAVLTLCQSKRFSHARERMHLLDPLCWTPSLTRSALRMALSDKNINQCLRIMASHAQQFPAHHHLTGYLLTEVVQLVINSHNATSNALALQRLLQAYGPGMLPTRARNLLTDALLKYEVRIADGEGTLAAASTEDLDKRASALLRSGKWEAALHIVDAMRLQRAPRGSHDAFLLAALHATTVWRDALALFL